MGKIKNLTVSEARKLEREAKQGAAKLVADAISLRVAELKETREYKALETELDSFESFSHKNIFYTIDEGGFLVSRIGVQLPDTLCCDEAGDDDEELAKAVLESCLEFPHYELENGTSGARHWIAEQCHGEPCIISYPSERGCYAVYSPDLGLKINKIESERHGLMLVERAVRAKGYFPDVGSVDYGGEFHHLSIPDDIKNATDEELAKMIDAEESGNESDEGN